MVLRFIEGLGFYVMPVMVTTMAADIFPPGERGRAMGLFSSAGGVGALIGPLISPLLISGNDYTTYFLFSGGFVAVSAVAMLFFVRETLQKGAKPSGDMKGSRLDVRGFLRSVRGLGAVVAIFLVAILIYRTGLTMIDPFLSLFMKDVRNIALSEMSYVFAFRALATIVFSPLAGVLVDRSGSKIVLLVGILMSALMLIGYTIPGGFQWMSLLQVFNGVSWALMMTSMNTMMADLLSADMRGFGLGLQSSISQQSSTIGALFSGFLIDAYGYNFVFYLAAASCLATMIIIQLFVPKPNASVNVRYRK
jgi:MFS family permease